MILLTFSFFQRNFGEFEIPRDLIERGDRLGSGSFGTVYSGIYHHPNDGDIQCAIKEARSEELGDSFREKLLDEAYIMRYLHNPDKYLYLSHPNSQLCGRGRGGPSYV